MPEPFRKEHRFVPILIVWHDSGDVGRKLDQRSRVTAILMAGKRRKRGSVEPRMMIAMATKRWKRTDVQELEFATERRTSAALENYNDDSDGVSEAQSERLRKLE